MSNAAHESGSEPGWPGNDDVVLARTKQWLERAVIGLNLCPFAQAVYQQNRIRFVVSRATHEPALLETLAAEMEFLRTVDPVQCDTTLLIHPEALLNFSEYNEFLGVADELLCRLQLEGVLQIASFHPRYRFAGTDPEDITNHTNRSPYPMLHLLRESSVSRAVSGSEDSSRIVERNLATLHRLGPLGWKQLGVPTSPIDL